MKIRLRFFVVISIVVNLVDILLSKGVERRFDEVYDDARDTADDKDFGKSRS